MTRIARVVIPGLPHHITQRGNGGQKVFFSDDDYRLYLDLLQKNCTDSGVACWAYCLLPHHIHAILVPSDADGLRGALAVTHRSYAGILNGRRKRTGHFWQGRYGAAVMDEAHLAAAFRYVLLSPVRAKLVQSPEEWPWSSAKAYLKRSNDGLTDTSAMRSRFPAMKAFLTKDAPELDDLTVKADETIGRPRGSAAFIKKLEAKTGRTLLPEKRGPKPKKTMGKKRRLSSE